LKFAQVQTVNNFTEKHKRTEAEAAMRYFVWGVSIMAAIV